MNDKLAVWKDTLGDDAPSRLLVPEAVKELPRLVGPEARIPGWRHQGSFGAGQVDPADFLSGAGDRRPQ